MTSGNRIGNKMYSFNTTVRMPDKNLEFLKLFKEYEGKLFDTEERTKFYIDAINEGIVTPNDIARESREKIRRGESLNGTEIAKILKDNIPPNGFGGRVGDFLGAMRAQGFIQKQGKRFRITKLGNELIDNPENEQDVYTKAMLKLQFGSKDRRTAKNRALPFLNLLFTMDGLNNIYANDDNFSNWGISEFEIGVFVLTMIDCDWRKTAQEIVEYRKKFQKKIDKDFALSFVHEKRGILQIRFETIFGSASYADEVMRKFTKTGLLSEKGDGGRVTHYTFSKAESEKVKMLLGEYRDYIWKEYNSVDDYYADVENVVLPWERSDSALAQAMSEKARIVGMLGELSSRSRATYEKIEEKYNNYIFESSNQFDELSMGTILNELELINGRVRNVRSILPNTEKHVRLEWFTALLLAKKFTKKNVKSNLTFYDDGTPKSCATGNMADIEFFTPDVNYNIEVTTIANAAQQENRETTTVLRHLDDKSMSTERECRAIMVAPYIHYDTITMYKIAAANKTINSRAVPITIDRLMEMVLNSNSTDDFNRQFETTYNLLLEEDVRGYQDWVNEYEFSIQEYIDGARNRG